MSYKKKLKDPVCFRNGDNKIFWKWTEQKPNIVTSTLEWNELVFECEKNLLKMTPLSFQKTLGNFQWNNGRYLITQAKNSKFLSLFICENYKVSVFITNQTYLCSEDSTTIEAEYDAQLRENGKKGVGTEAYRTINEMFQQQYQLKSNMYEILSGYEYIPHYTKIKQCVPKQIAWITMVKGRIIEHCYKADVSSAFPYQLTKPIPTLHASKTLQGRYMPSAEYPFAFYTKSHHIAIYDELETEEDNKSYYMSGCVDNYYEVDPTDEETILCKASKYSLDKIMATLYRQKKSKDVKLSQRAKLTMNGCIGYFQFNKHPGLCFISAVVIARNNHMMLDYIKQLEYEKNTILYVATDSIVWKGKQSDVATTNKKLGAFVYEELDCNFFGRAIGSYQIQKENHLVTKCSYLTKEKQKTIAFGELPESKKMKIIVDNFGQIHEV